MSTTDPKFRNGRFNGLESSCEILEAIEEVAGFEFDEDEPERCPCYRIWAEPTPAEMEAVEARAWQLADADVVELHWGEAVIYRVQS